MLLRANMLLSMASLVIFMQLRVLYEQLCGRLRRHGNYRRMLLLVQLNCPLEKLHFEQESEWEDNKCAICWEAAAIARRLPCGHHFHHGNLICLFPVFFAVPRKLQWPRLPSPLVGTRSYVPDMPATVTWSWFRRHYLDFAITIARECKFDILDRLEPFAAPNCRYARSNCFRKFTIRKLSGAGMVECSRIERVQ